MYSCIRFVVDDYSIGAFYISDYWSWHEILIGLGIDIQALNHKQKSDLKPFINKYFSKPISDEVLFEDPPQQLPKMVYLSEKDWKNHPDPSNFSGLPIKIPKDELIISNSDIVHKYSLQARGLNANTCILCLAACGLDILLPNVSFDLVAEEEIEKIRETLEEERKEYLNALTILADSAFDRIKSNNFEGIIEWARNEIHFKLVPKVRKIESAATKIDVPTLQRAGVSFWRDSVPAIGSGFVNGGLLQAAKITGTEALKIIHYYLAKEMEDRNMPELAYAVKLSKKL